MLARFFQIGISNFADVLGNRPMMSVPRVLAEAGEGISITAASSSAAIEKINEQTNTAMDFGARNNFTLPPAFLLSADGACLKARFDVLRLRAHGGDE